MSQKKRSFLHYGQQDIDKTDINAITKVMKSDFLTTGPMVERFEKKLASYANSKYAVVCSNGSAALLLSYLSLGMDNKTDCIIPSLNFAAAANAAKVLGSNLIFSDSCPESGLVRPKDLLQALTKRKYSKVFFVPVHMNGQAVNLEKLSQICRKNNVNIIEDASHALGTKFKKNDGRTFMIGSCYYSQMTTFSFHPVKTITMGEGGAVTTNNKNIYEKLVKYRNNGIVRSPTSFKNKRIDFSKILDNSYYEIHNYGLNLRASDIHCALGLNQLKRIDKFALKRKKIVSMYDELFSSEKQWVKPIKKINHSVSVFHLYVILLNIKKIKVSKSKLISALRKNLIGTMVHYIPLHLQPVFSNEINLIGAEKYYNNCLSLPLHTNMNFSDVKRVVRNLKQIAVG